MSLSQLGFDVTNHGGGEDDTTSHGSGQEEKSTKPMTQEEITKKESRAVFFSRSIVLLVLLTSTIGVVGLVFSYMTYQEQEYFERDFESAATKVFDSIGQTLSQTLGASDSFVVHLLSHSKYSSPTPWPFVAMPGFALHAAKMIKQAKAFFVALNVIVEPEQLGQWNNFSAHNMDWVVKDAMQVQATDQTYFGPSRFPVSRTTFHHHIWDTVNNPKTELKPKMNVMGNYMPVWQHYPVVPFGAMNLDGWQMGNRKRALIDIVPKKRVAVFPTLSLDDNINRTDAYYVENRKKWIRWAKLLMGDEIDATEPSGVVLYPMYDYLGGVETISKDATDAKFVGSITYNFFWKQFLVNILPHKAQGLVVVIHVTCDIPFTYVLDGPKATYLGPGDQHDPKFDEMGQVYSLHAIMAMNATQSDPQSVYTGIPLTETHCPTYVHVYPSQDMEDDYKTRNPLFFTISAAAIFIFTSIVFVLYDCLVARRQRVIKSQALASGAIVSSLFPEKVRKQMIEDRRQDQKQQNNRISKTLDFLQSKRNSKNLDFLDMTNHRGLGGPSTLDHRKGKPMADIFDHTTIFFADLAGFTAWSAKRSPVEVFELLEAIYSRFDAIAQRRGVFKVETIGDCYVAVTGIPQPQAHHAAILARFARDCMVEMAHVTVELSQSLGEDTKDLEMRVGLHSGSTTAGVLRGDKGRFQLFGDTVNTASRMESNGVKGRIHVSQATADYLIADGKGHWLEERKGRITAKGKGEMVTYFVNISKGAATKSIDTVSKDSMMLPESSHSISFAGDTCKSTDITTGMEDYVIDVSC